MTGTNLPCAPVPVLPGALALPSGRIPTCCPGHMIDSRAISSPSAILQEEIVSC